MTIESRIERLEANLPKQIDGEALMQNIYKKCDHARDEVARSRMMDEMIEAMTDEEIAAALKYTAQERERELVAKKVRQTVP
ncbi:MAG: hypothetical protein ACRESI_01190 [Gammaproteobacteria bacterium]